jgi:hypothetical protein
MRGSELPPERDLHPRRLGDGSVIARNRVRGCGDGIAVEDGRRNLVNRNRGNISCS